MSVSYPASNLLLRIAGVGRKTPLVQTKLLPVKVERAAGNTAAKANWIGRWHRWLAWAARRPPKPFTGYSES